MDSKFAGAEIELPTQVFAWLESLGVMHETYRATAGPRLVQLTQQAANAVVSGHALFYAAHGIAAHYQVPLPEVTLAGTVGELCDSQSVLHNWTAVAGLLAVLGMDVPEDDRSLIAAGDASVVQQTLRDLFTHFTGEPIQAAVPQERDGAVSVDTGIRRQRERKRHAMAQQGLEHSRAKFAARVDRDRERERRHEDEMRRAAAVRRRVEAAVGAKRRGVLETVAAPLPVFREFGNRSVVQHCAQLVGAMVEAVLSGEAQTDLQAKEEAKERARRTVKKRRELDNRLVDGGAAVRLPKGVNHTLGLMAHDIFMRDIFDVAVLPNAREHIEKKERRRLEARDTVARVLTRLDKQEQRRRDEAQRVEEQRRAAEAREQAEAAQRSQKLEKLRVANRERAECEREKLEAAARAKELERQAEQEKAKRREAEQALYFAEQKAKLIEYRQAQERKRQETEAAQTAAAQTDREERRRAGLELNRKLQEKEQRRLQQLGRAGDGPPTLTTESVSSGDHAAYFGETLGWQYLTEPEFDVAQVLCQVRGDPASLAPVVEERTRQVKGRCLHWTDSTGQRHPMALREGAAAFDEAHDFLLKARPVRPAEDVSIGLTLAARQHATDLVFHAKAYPEHCGTDGSTVAQRVQRYGHHAVRPGVGEVVVAVVRPEALAMPPVDVLALAIVGDGDNRRSARATLLDVQMAESIGVGHAVAATSFGCVVEAFVLLLSYSFVDKPVAWMSSAHQTGIGTVAPPFTAGLRVVCDAVRSRRDLAVAGNCFIGRTAALPNLDALTADTSLRHTRTTDLPPLSPSPDPPKPAPRLGPGRAPAASEATRRRLVRFYEHYAPHKLPIVDNALQMFRGREEELFVMLVRKYGEEPTDDTPPLAAARDAQDEVQQTESDIF